MNFSEEGLRSTAAPHVDVTEVSTADDDYEEFIKVNTSEISHNVKDDVQVDGSSIYIFDILETDPRRETIEGSGEKSENQFDVKDPALDSSENHSEEDHSDFSSHSEASLVSSQFLLLSAILQLFCRIF